jgi:hypothetical protein
MSIIPALARAGADRHFRFDLPGKVPDIVFCDGTCANAKELDTHNGGGKWMYDEAARSFGFDPKAARQNPEMDAKVVARLDQTIDQLIADAKNGTPKSAVAWHSSFRNYLTQVTRDEESKITAALNQKQIETIAALPGASTFADPAVRGAMYEFVAMEQRVLTATAPQFGKAAQVGTALGTGATLAIASTFAPDAPVEPQTKPADETQSEASTVRTPLNAAAAALDANKDNKLQCKEIGTWVVDTGFDSRSANAKAYQNFISGRPGMDFEVPRKGLNPINFDGCKDTPLGPLLLEAKAKHGEVLTGGWSDAPGKIADQGFEQDKAAGAIGVRNEWHVQVAEEADIIRNILERDAKVQTPVHHTDMPIVK